MRAAYVPFPALADWVGSFDGSLVDEFAAQLESARREYGDAAAARATEVATRYAAVDTGAIEGLYTTNRGFTRTIAQRSVNWEATLAAHPEAEHHIRDALAGYEFVLDAVTGRVPITQSWIRQLHEVLCASQESYTVYVEVAGTLHPEKRPLPKGEYKSAPNFPMNPDTGVVHHYATVEDTPAEMARLVSELGSDAFAAAHPVVQAAYAHYAFVCVHPFADGNGRVARALASVFLYRRPGIPLVIFADQTPAYLDALSAADAGRPEAFVSFVEQRAIDTVNLVLAELPTMTSQADSELAQAISGKPLSAPPGVRLARTVRGLLAHSVADVLAHEELPAHVSAAVSSDDFAGSYVAAREGSMLDPVSVTLSWVPHTACAVTLHYFIVVNEPWSASDVSPDARRHPVLSIVTDGAKRSGQDLRVWSHEVGPTASRAFELRLRAWVRGRLEELKRELAVRIREQRADEEG